MALGVNPLPDGTVYEGEFQRVGRVLTQVADREEWLAGLKSVPNVAVVYDTVSELRSLPLPETKSQPVRQESIGLHDALLDAGMHFDVVQTSHLDPTGYRAILLGDAVRRRTSCGISLTRFVHDGGLLIATTRPRYVTMPDGGGTTSPGPTCSVCN